MQPATLCARLLTVQALADGARCSVPAVFSARMAATAAALAEQAAARLAAMMAAWQQPHLHSIKHHQQHKSQAVTVMAAT